MRLNFRQGIVSSELDISLSPDFITITPSGLNIITDNSPVVVTLADQDTNYLFTETTTVLDAWPVAASATPIWLYWDLDVKTGARTFGYTFAEPVHGPTQPATPVDDLHWFDTNSNTMRVYSTGASQFFKRIRVFAAKYESGVLDYFPLGTQVGIETTEPSFFAGRIAYDATGSAIRKDNGTFFTTEDQFFVSGAFSQTIRLEANVVFATAQESIPAYSVVKLSDFGEVSLADYEDIGSSLLAMTVEDATFGKVINILVQGTVVNPAWSWPVAGATLWVDTNGELTNVDPNSINLLREKQVPVARVISQDTIIFEQGLGGKGEQGDPGVITGVSPATTTTYGLVQLSTPPVTDSIAVGDNDPRLTDARTPLPHTHTATEVNITPIGVSPSANAQEMLEELDSGKLSRSGGAMTGFLSLSGTPVNNLHATTKAYVDSLASGLIWISPICLVNLISDGLTTPPATPANSDAYIVATGGTGAWTGLDGRLVIWEEDTTSWLDRGDFATLASTLEHARFGVSLTSSTVASGTFVGQDNSIAVYDTIGATWSFEPVVENNAVYVCNDISLFAYSQYVYDGSIWILFGGPQPITPGNLLSLSGNVLNVTLTAGDNLEFTGDTLNVVNLPETSWRQSGPVIRTDNGFWQPFTPGPGAATWDGTQWVAGTDFEINLRVNGTWPTNFRPIIARLNISKTITTDIFIRDASNNIIGTSEAPYFSGDPIILDFSGTGDIEQLFIDTGDNTTTLSEITFETFQDNVGTGPYIAGDNLEFNGSTMNVFGLQRELELGNGIIIDETNDSIHVVGNVANAVTYIPNLSAALIDIAPNGLDLTKLPSEPAEVDEDIYYSMETVLGGTTIEDKFNIAPLTLVGTAAQTTGGGGKFGEGVELDGTSGCLDKAVDVEDPTERFFAAWVDFDDTTSIRTIYSHSDTPLASSFTPAIVFRANNDRLELIIQSDGDAASTLIQSPASSLVTGSGYRHVAFNFTTSGTCEIWLDNVSVATQSVSLAGGMEALEERIGCFFDGTTDQEFLDGRIDEVHIWAQLKDSIYVDELFTQFDNAGGPATAVAGPHPIVEPSYWETTLTSSVPGSMAVGIAQPTFDVETGGLIGQSGLDSIGLLDSGNVFRDGVQLAISAGFNGTDITVRHRFDPVAGNYDIAVEAGPWVSAITGLTGDWLPAVTMNDVSNVTGGNFSQRVFKYPTPTGFKAGVRDVLKVTGDTISTDPTGRTVATNATVDGAIDQLDATLSNLTIPYDLGFFIAGTMLEDIIVGSYLATRGVTIAATAPGSLAIAEVAPLVDITFTVLVNGSSVGDVTFLAGSTTGTITISSQVVLAAGDKIQIKTPLTPDSTIENVSITLVGCATALLC